MLRVVRSQVWAERLVGVERAIADTIDCPDKHASHFDALHFKGDLLGSELSLEHTGGKLGNLIIRAFEARKTDSCLLEYAVVHDQHPFVGSAGNIQSLHNIPGLLGSKDEESQDCTVDNDIP